MTKYLLDTNHISALLRGGHSLEARLAQKSDAGFFLCIPSAGELYHMIFNSARVDENRALLEVLLGGFEILPYDLSASIEFGRILTELRRMGKPIPSIDAQIAAVAIVNGCILLTSDSHFSSLTGLPVENWMTN